MSDKPRPSVKNSKKMPSRFKRELQEQVSVSAESAPAESIPEGPIITEDASEKRVVANVPEPASESAPATEAQSARVPAVEARPSRVSAVEAQPVRIPEAEAQPARVSVAEVQRTRIPEAEAQPSRVSVAEAQPSRTRVSVSSESVETTYRDRVASNDSLDTTVRYSPRSFDQSPMQEDQDIEEEVSNRKKPSRRAKGARPSVRDKRSVAIPTGTAEENDFFPLGTYEPTVVPSRSTRAASRFSKEYKRNRESAYNRNVYIPSAKGTARAMIPAATYKRRVSIPHKIARFIGALAAIALMAIVVLIGVLTVTEYRPADTEEVPISYQAINTVSEGQQLSIVTWNLGYCGLSPEADFFMDGGDGVRTVSEEGVSSNLQNVKSKLAELDPDIMLLQEVDKDSRRSYHMDESNDITQTFQQSGYSSAFATNYLSMFVPYPYPPIGQVYSGIQTESRFAADTATRMQLPCPFDWPERLGNLKRCLLVERIPIADSDKELVLINLHLEAYDDGEGKTEQTAQLVKFMQREFEKGNYVIAGGDFNQSFSNIDTSAYPLQGGDLWQCGLIDAESFDEGWQLVMDPTVPTCRSLDRPYNAGDTNFQYYMIDGYICSANVQVDETATIDTGFNFSDHNPVKITVTLKADE